MTIGSTGLLIIRAYLENGSTVPLRAEIRLTSDVSAGIERTLTLADADRVAEVVRSWLIEDILKTPAAGSGHHPPGDSELLRDLAGAERPAAASGGMASPRSG